jgi:hypothetical protein
MARLIAFGDSWTVGDCTDLIIEGVIEKDDNVTDFINKTAMVFKNPWPGIVADRFELALENKAIPGNCNKSIITQLYDFHLFNKFRTDDIVIVSLSTWYRDYQWQPESQTNFNSIFFKRSKSAYESRSLYQNTSDVNKIAYDAFFDFFTVKSFLESVSVQYYIGWAFTQVDDFKEHLTSEYVEDINGTKNLLEPFVNFCKFVNYEKLLHPTLDDHKRYGEYICNRIINDGF